MSTLSELWSFIWTWYNLPFTLSIIFSLFLSALQFTGLLGDVVDFDGDVDVDFDADVDVDADLDLDGDMDADAVPELVEGVGGSGGGLRALFDLLGIGRVPLMLLLLLFSATFGLLGWVLSNLWLTTVGSEQWFFFVGLWIVTFVISAVISGRLGGVIAKLVPSISTTAKSNEQLVGKVAKVISPRVNERYGQVRVYDAAGTSLTLFAVIPKNNTPIPRDTEVVLADFDPERKVYTVVKLRDEL
ncbi:MAG: hypothetical protein ACPGWR_01060 [Ardenticatenaceae bacterium]